MEALIATAIAFYLWIIPVPSDPQGTHPEMIWGPITFEVCKETAVEQYRKFGERYQCRTKEGNIRFEIGK